MILFIIIPKKEYGFTNDIKSKLDDLQIQSELINIQNDGEVYYLCFTDIFNSKTLEIWGKMNSDSMNNLLNNTSFAKYEMNDTRMALGRAKEIPKMFLKELGVTKDQSNSTSTIELLQSPKGTIITLFYKDNNTYMNYIIVYETGFFRLESRFKYMKFK